MKAGHYGRFTHDADRVRHSSATKCLMSRSSIACSIFNAETRLQTAVKVLLVHRCICQPVFVGAGFEPVLDPRNVLYPAANNKGGVAAAEHGLMSCVLVPFLQLQLTLYTQYPFVVFRNILLLTSAFAAIQGRALSQK